MAATTSNPITAYRRADKAIRGIARNQGRTAATTNALHRWWVEQDRVIRALLEQDTDLSRYIAGLLTEESKLTRRDWQDRPELKARVNAVRQELRDLERQLDNVTNVTHS